MKKPSNWKEVKAAGERVKLPAGGYEAKIINAKVVSYDGSNGSYERLEIAVDITAGEYKDYYKQDFDNNTRDDKKWRGVARFYVPTDDGSEKDEYTKSVLKSVTDALEDSNKGYHWDWDETALKGLKVGILVRDKEYDIDGKRGFSPEIFRFTDIKRIKEGKFTVPKQKLLKGFSEASEASSGTDSAASGDDDYPF
ncbi:MAG: hypothetical protein ACI4WS_00955 [Oscillospiraceae bacterium]